MESIGKYNLTRHNEPAMAVNKFTWYADEQHRAVLQWNWPPDQKVKLMLVFALDESDGSEEFGEPKEPCLADLLWQNHEHSIVSRSLSNIYQTPICTERRRFMICPAYFNEENTVVVYEPAYITDWICKKNRIAAKVQYAPLPLSKYNKVVLNLKIPKDCLNPYDVIQYGIYENNHLIGVYPLDEEMIDGKYAIYIPKNQKVRFLIDNDHAHKFELE